MSLQSTQNTTDELILQLESQPDATYQAGLLRPLTIAITGLTIAGLLVTVFIPPLPNLRSAVVIMLSLAINVLIMWLIHLKKTQIASYIFCVYINIGVLFFFYSNLLINADQVSAATFSCILTLSVLLAGLLLGSRWGFIFALLNSIFVVLGNGLFSFYYPNGDGSVFQQASRLSFPVIVFLMMVATISYLYQRALARKDERLRLARERILSDELLRRDMAVAREMQQRLYPPPPLTNAQIEIAAFSEPARETSGDFYDYIDLGAGQLGIVVADVTGKSLAAAMVMAMARSAIRSEARRHSSPAEVLQAANLTLCEDSSVQQMLTCFYGVLDTVGFKLCFANAGHPYPIVRRNGSLSELVNNGLPLGARADASYENRQIQLLGGDQLILLSDGTFEERNDERELFGFDRLHATIAAVDSDDPRQMVAAIKAAVDQFRGSREQSDDLTMVAIQIQPHAAAIGQVNEPLRPSVISA